MNEEPLSSSFSESTRPDEPPERIGEDDLLKDLRDLIVTEDSESMKVMLSIVSGLQAKIEDRQELVNLLKPVLASAIRARDSEEPHELREALTPIVLDILRDHVPVEESAPASPASRLRRALCGVRERTRALFVRAKPRQPLVEEPPLDRPEPEVCDADFALVEFLLLARPSLVLLAHGSWREPHHHARSEEQLLPLIRRFIRTKAEERELDEPLRARFDRYGVLIEPAQHAFLAALYEGTPAVGFLLDVRQTLADLHARHTDALRRNRAIPQYRRFMRILLDRYRPAESRMGAQAREDPVKWPPPGDRVAGVTQAPPR